jgi:hypothetical protein
MGKTKSGIKRRTFLNMGALSLMGTDIPKVHAESKKRKPEDLLRIGLILGEWAHSTGWAPMMNGINGDTTFPKRTGMIYTHVWHIKREVAEEFAKKYGITTVVNSFDDMIGKVDGIIIDTLFQTPWIYKLAEPYLENKIPVFSDRPFADAVWKVKRIIELAKKHNTPFWSGSSLECMYQRFQAQQHNPPESITSYKTWSEGTPDYYSHGLHGIWWTHKITGGGIHAISHITKAWNKGGGTSTILHKDRGNGSYRGKIYHQKRENCLIWTKFEGNDMIYRYDTGHWDTFVYLPLLLTVQNIFYFGIDGLPESYESFLEKSKFFLSGFRSCLREGGEFVELDNLDEDWSVGCPWGHIYMPGKDIYDAYSTLLGPEKGEISPPE